MPCSPPLRRGRVVAAPVVLSPKFVAPGTICFRGSQATTDLDVSDAFKAAHLLPLARRAMRAVGARFASVDIVRLVPAARCATPAAEGERKTASEDANAAGEDASTASSSVAAATDQQYAQFANSDGFLVLEINSSVMLDGFLQQHPQSWDVARDMYVSAVTKAVAAQGP